MEFFDTIKNMQLPPTSKMVSFDIVSLYTNIPTKETVDIITNNLYENNNFRGLSKLQFRKLINLLIEDNYFLFNGKLRKQIDGLAMGNPISATFANIFMSHHEKQWLENCPQQFKPLIYRRYVDDTFMIFEREEQINQFYEYLNKQHQKISFTMEKEENNKLPFLDLLLEKNNENKLDISIYRKPTYTGLGTNFLSACFEEYKTNTITTFLHRAFSLTSNFQSFHIEVEFLRRFFKENGFTDNLFFKYLRRFLNNKYDNREKKQGPEKQTIFVKFPFISRGMNTTLKREIKELLNKHLPQLTLKIAIYNNYKIKSFFKIKEQLPRSLSSSTVYLFTCSKCSLEYVGSTIKNLTLRVDEHRGVSSRTGFPLVRPLNSSIRDHCRSVCDVNFSLNDFQVLKKTTSVEELRIAESILIKMKKTALNSDMSSYPLNMY